MPIAPIEIKSSNRLDEKDVRNLARFARAFTEPLAVCISRDPDRTWIESVLCLPWREALKELGLGLSGPAISGSSPT